jgi:hypothetical protein
MQAMALAMALAMAMANGNSAIIYSALAPAPAVAVAVAVVMTGNQYRTPCNPAVVIGAAFALTTPATTPTQILTSIPLRHKGRGKDRGYRDRDGSRST